MSETSSKADVHTLITNHFIANLEQGIMPWYASFTETGIPKNLVSGIPYNGINIWMLAELGYSQNLFVTHRQATELGAKIKRGEKGHLAVYWLNEEEQTNLKYYKLYNVSQCENLPADKLFSVEKEKHNDPVALCKEIIDSMPKPPHVHFDGATAYYSPGRDSIHMPQHEFFDSNELFYGALFYTLIQSTGHVSRLNRDECMARKPLGAREYSREELIAQMGASFLCSLGGIKCLYPTHHTEDVDGWIDAFLADEKLAITAAAQAQKAVNYILNLPKENFEKVRKA